MRRAAWILLTSDGDQGGDPEAYFKAHRDKTNKTNDGALFLGGAQLFALAVVLAQLAAHLFPGQAASSPHAALAYIVTVLGILLVAVLMIGYAMGIALRNSWLLMPVYKWCRYNLFDQLWRKWQGDTDGEGKKARAKIRL